MPDYLELFKNETSYVSAVKCFSKYIENCLQDKHLWLDDISLCNIDDIAAENKNDSDSECTSISSSSENSYISYIFIELVAKAVKDSRCKWSLIMIRRNITDDLLECLCDALYDNYTVTDLDFRYNTITDIGCEYIADLCKVNKTIKDIFIGDNNISKIGKKILKNCCKDRDDLVIFCNLSAIADLDNDDDDYLMY